MQEAKVPRERRDAGLTAFINAEDLCKAWAISDRTLRRLVADGELEAVLMLKRLKVTKASAEAFLARQRAEAEARGPQVFPQRREEFPAA
jgi:hypothetical protein